MIDNYIIYYLDEKIFLPFLLDNELNKISLWMDMNERLFDCNDYRNYWLKKNQNITKRVYLNCPENKQLNDSDNFKKLYLIINCLINNK